MPASVPVLARYTLGLAYIAATPTQTGAGQECLTYARGVAISTQQVQWHRASGVLGAHCTHFCLSFTIQPVHGGRFSMLAPINACNMLAAPLFFLEPPHPNRSPPCLTTPNFMETK